MATPLQKWISLADPNAVSLVPRPIGNRGGGFGMVCNAPIKKGDKLVAVPRKLWLTSQTAKESDICKHLITGNQLEAWQSLCLHLLCERRIGSESFWADYIEQLPNQDALSLYGNIRLTSANTGVVFVDSLGQDDFAKEEHPLLWTPDLQQKLKGSPMAKRLATRLEQVQSDTENLRSLGANDMLPSTSDSNELVTVDTVKWAAATLLSRAFNLEIPTTGVPARPLDRSSMGRDGAVDFQFDVASLGGASENGSSSLETDADIAAALEAVAESEHVSERILALVPWADTLNHSSEAWDLSILQYDHVEDVAVMFAHKDYSPGEEVYDSYGTWLTPSELLLDYGFVDPTNRNYAIQVPAESIAQPLSPTNAKLMSMLHASLNGAPELTLTETAVDDTLLSYMRCALAPPDELALAGWVEDSSDENMPMNTMARLVEPCNFNTEAKVLETLLAWCDRQMAGYATTLQSDMEEVEGEATPWLNVQILRALISEKKSVVGLQKELRARNQLLKEGCPLDQLYA